jgi:hypothetical protein
VNYIVVGHRSGSSMMMRCIALSSNLPTLAKEIERPIWGPDYEEGYDPNPYGYYETEPPREVEMYESWEHEVDGYLFKADADWLFNLNPGPGYSILLMLRNPDEVRGSHRRAFGSEIDEQHFADLDRLPTFCESRSDITLTTLNFVDVIFDPVPAFTKLRDVGWPIDVEKAASFVDPALYRTRIDRP